MAEHTPSLDIGAGRCSQSHIATLFGVGGRSCVCVFPKRGWRQPHSPPGRGRLQCPEHLETVPPSLPLPLPLPTVSNPSLGASCGFHLEMMGESLWAPNNPRAQVRTPAPLSSPDFYRMWKSFGPPSLPAFISEQGNDGRLCGTEAMTGVTELISPNGDTHSKGKITPMRGFFRGAYMETVLCNNDGGV